MIFKYAHFRKPPYVEEKNAALETDAQYMVSRGDIQSPVNWQRLHLISWYFLSFIRFSLKTQPRNHVWDHVGGV